jgi:hypothetical protein
LKKYSRVGPKRKHSDFQGESRRGENSLRKQKKDKKITREIRQGPYRLPVSKRKIAKGKSDFAVSWRR